MQSGDGLIIFLIVLVLGTWLFMYIRGRMIATVTNAQLPIPVEEEDVQEDEATRLLEAQGFTILRGKQRIPIDISVNDAEVLQSRLFIDYLVERDGMYYVVKLAKDRKPLEMTGSALRDRLLVYQLLYPQTAGVLHLDVPQGKVSVVMFELDREA